MKVLSLHQPWATLVALGVKSIETRSWPTTYRGQLAIHAATRRPRVRFGSAPLSVGDYDVCWTDDEGLILRHERDDDGQHGEWYPLPFGAIVATAELADCVPMVNAGEEGAIRTLDIDDNGTLWIVEPQTDEEYESGAHPEWYQVTAQRPYGDFRAGRWAWLLANVRPLPEPVPFRGGQALSREWTP